MNLDDMATRYFSSYSGVQLPFKLVGELQQGDIENRNTFFVGYYDNDNRLCACEKRVYGDVELSHRYHYSPQGKLTRAEIQVLDEELEVVDFAD